MWPSPQVWPRPLHGCVQGPLRGQDWGPAFRAVGPGYTALLGERLCTLSWQLSEGEGTGSCNIPEAEDIRKPMLPLSFLSS